MLERMREDIDSVLERDPAAMSVWHVALTYPGVHAVWAHRLASHLWRSGWRLPAHFVARFARWWTGIEIHPAASIGRRLFIDHGMGVVIGETAEIRDDVTLYHGVTLGGVSLAKGKRHPTLEDGVVVGAGAKVLGAITIGRDTRVGANAVVIKDVEPDMVVVGIPGKASPRHTPLLAHKPDLQHGNLPDVMTQRLDVLIARLDQLEAAQRGRADDERALAKAELTGEVVDYAI
ncbi:MAG: serine O-acetyltransferase [Chloroflexota bacterium]|nr:serine O-acetyltransferase [Chloroflexota bacterium]